MLGYQVSCGIRGQGLKHFLSGALRVCSRKNGYEASTPLRYPNNRHSRPLPSPMIGTSHRPFPSSDR